MGRLTACSRFSMHCDVIAIWDQDVLAFLKEWVQLALYLGRWRPHAPNRFEGHPFLLHVILHRGAG